MSGDPGSTFTATETTLSPELQPYVTKGLKEADRLYNEGGPAYYTGQNYVSPSEATSSGLAAMGARATAGSPLLRQAQQNIQSQMGYNSPFVSKLESLGAQAYDPSAEFYRGIQNGGFKNESLEGTRSTASGAYLNPNQYLNGALGQANRLATESFQQGMQGIQGQAAAAGRYGSGAMGQLVGKGQDVFSRALAEQNQQAYLQNYQLERTAQEAAIARLGGLSQQGLDNRMAASQLLTSGEQQALETKLSATKSAQEAEAQDLARQQTAAGMAPGLAAADYADIERMLAVGTENEKYAALKMAGDKERYDYTASLPYNNLEKFGSYITNLPRGGITKEYVEPGAAVESKAAGYFSNSSR